MEVLGRDAAQDAYRIASGVAGHRVVGLIPCHVIAAGTTLTGGRGHQTAYDWIARNRTGIEHALKALREGRDDIPAPFDRMVLTEED